MTSLRKSLYWAAGAIHAALSALFVVCEIVALLVVCFLLELFLLLVGAPEEP